MTKEQILDRIFNTDPFGILDTPLNPEEEKYLNEHPEIFNVEVV